MGNALEALFSSEEPKKERKAERKAEVAAEKKAIKTTSPAKKPKKAAPMKTCTVCEEEVYAIHTKDGICKDCRMLAKNSVASPVSKPKAQKPKVTPPKKTTKPKTEGRKRGLESDEWHEKEATYNQTSFLKKSTGLQTWSNENFTLKRLMTRLEASVMITEIKKGNGGVKDVTKILKEEFGCVKYVRPGKSSIPDAIAHPDPAVKIDRNTAKELVDMKHTIRDLEAKLEAALALIA